MPYIAGVKDVVELASYLAAADDAGLDEAALEAIVDTLASQPDIGDLIAGSGGARKFRWARRNEGKSGGYRIITYYPGAERVCLIDVFAKNAKANLDKAELNALKKLTATLER